MGEHDGGGHFVAVLAAGATPPLVPGVALGEQFESIGSEAGCAAFILQIYSIPGARGLAKPARFDNFQGMTQPIAGVAPSQLSEVTNMVVWPSLSAMAFGRVWGRLFALEYGPHIFGVPVTIGRHVCPGVDSVHDRAVLSDAVAAVSRS